MKPIVSVPIWVNGQVKSGTWLGAYIIKDNLQDSATFYWWISANGYEPDSIGDKLSEGNLTIVDPEYDQWGQSGDINQAAYDWIAAQLGLTLI